MNVTKLSVEKLNRIATVQRKSKETEILVEVNLDQSALNDIKTPLPFFTHMLDTLACHGRMGLILNASGDIDVDPHHLMEDVGIVLGQSIFEALGGLNGIQRAGCFSFPMDGSLAVIALDLCGRRNLVWNVELSNRTIGTLDPHLFKEFFKGLVDGLRCTLHINLMYGDNDHHVIEAIFKGFARALRQAIEPVDNNATLSTKGMFDES
jgi:imidazoleglycerol phosphate dehydratase HisB